jgi:glycosyltransferase involved in cell wall biosynthesis
VTFSVGIPTFNQAEYLGATIESLLNQTLPPDEIVVSDHYSTDDTQDVIARYAKHVRSVKPPKGANLTGQYNFTLETQQADWITLLSSDDVAKPNFCEVLMRGAARHEEAVLVRAGWQQIDAAGNTLGQNYLLSIPRVESPPANVVSQRYGPKVNFASFAVKREAFMKSGPILESLESLSDWALFVQVAPFGAFVCEHEVISGYRVGHDGNKFRDRLGAWCRDQKRVFDSVLPLAAKRAGIRDTEWIREASRYNFLRYAATASEEFTAEERATIVPFFAEWAESVGGTGELAALAAGEKMRAPMSLMRRVRRRLHPLVHRAYSAMRGR